MWFPLLLLLLLVTNSLEKTTANRRAKIKRMQTPGGDVVYARNIASLLECRVAMGTLSTYDKARWRSGCFPPPITGPPVHSYGILALAMGYYSSSLSSRETRARSGLRLRTQDCAAMPQGTISVINFFSSSSSQTCPVSGRPPVACRAYMHTYAMHVRVQLHACMQSTAEGTCSVCNVAIRPYFSTPPSSLPLSFSLSSLQPLLLSPTLPTPPLAAHPFGIFWAALAFCMQNAAE